MERKREIERIKQQQNENKDRKTETVEALNEEEEKKIGNENVIREEKIDGITRRIDFTFDFVYLFISFQNS